MSNVDYRQGVLTEDRICVFAEKHGLKIREGDAVDMLWVDVETTGLLNDPAAFVLEVGAIATNYRGDLTPGCIWSSPVVLSPRMPYPFKTVMATMDPTVLQMHSESRLLREIEVLVEDGDVGRHRADGVYESFYNWTRDLGLQPDTFPMCGSTVEFDRSFLRRDLPRIEEFFHHRTINVSSFKEAAKLVNPGVAGYWKELTEHKVKEHRTLPDLAASIREWKFYLDNFLWVELPVEGTV